MYEKNQKLKTFALIALIMASVGCLSYFVTYSWDFSDYFNTRKTLSITFPSLKSLLYMLAGISCPVTLFLYMNNSYGKSDCAVPFKAIMYIAIAVNQTLLLLQGVKNIQSIFFTIPLAAVSTLCAVYAFQNKPNKLFAVLVGGIGLGVTSISLFSLLDSFEYYLENIIFLFTTLASIGGRVFLYLTMLFLGMEENAPSESIYVNTDYRQQIAELQRMYQQGYINDEEYEQKRLEIINRK